MRFHHYFDEDDDYFNGYADTIKQEILKDIKLDLDNSLEGIRRLPKGARRGVYLAYKYYFNLYRKLSSSSVENILAERIRVSDKRKAYLLMNTVVKNSLNLV
jgi:phytoene/squalene synthetase